MGYTAQCVGVGDRTLPEVLVTMSHLWEELSSAQLTERLNADPDCVALIPVGATEQHGLHLPVGTDTIIAMLACAAAGEVAVAASTCVRLQLFSRHAAGGHHRVLRRGDGSRSRTGRRGVRGLGIPAGALCQRPRRQRGRTVDRLRPLPAGSFQTCGSA